MGLDGLLGNRRIKENIAGSFRSGRVSHFYLLSGPEGSGKHTLARLMAAAALCPTHGPCLSCPSCRKVMEDMHPDVIWADEPEKKTVSVALMRKIRSDVFVRPNEADRKIVIFPRGQDMTVEAQNALLKVLEEPPAYGVFLLLTDNPDKMLPTVRSRCTQLTMEPLPEETVCAALRKFDPAAGEEAIRLAGARSGGYLGRAQKLLAGGNALSSQTKAFGNAFAGRNALGLMNVLVPMEKWKREDLIAELQSWAELLEDALADRCGSSASMPAARVLGEMRSARDFIQAIACLKKAMEYAQANVSPAAICGYLQWALRL